MTINSQREAAGLPPYEPRPKTRALLDAISKLSRASSDLGSGVPPLLGGRAALVRRWTEAYEDVTRMVVELELDA